MNARRAKVFVVLAVAVLGGVALGYWFYRQTVGYSPLPAPPVTAFQAQAARAEIREAEEQIREAARAVKAGEKPRLNLQVHEESINTLLNEDLAARLSQAGVHEPRVQVLPGAVVQAGAWVQRGGRRVWVSGTLQLTSSGGKLTVEPLDMRLGNMPMPAFMEHRLTDRLRRRLDALNLGPNGQNIEVNSSQGILRISTAQ